MRQIENPISSRLSALADKVRRIIGEPRAIQEVHDGSRSAESLHADFGIAALMEADPDKTTPYITWILKEGPSSYLAIGVMHKMMEIAAKTNGIKPLPETAAPWMQPIAEAIERDEANRFVLSNEEIIRFFSSFCHPDAIQHLADSLGKNIHRHGKRLGEKRHICFEMVELPVPHQKLKPNEKPAMGSYGQHTYEATYELVNPVDVGIVASLYATVIRFPDSQEAIISAVKGKILPSETIVVEEKETNII